MNENIMFSVLVLTYNQENYIRQTLDSILYQDHEYSYEIIVGEDCSTDNTKKIIEDYVTRYPDIIKPIYNKTNKGLIKNYFNSLSQCSGKYIMECAGDDYWLPGKVKAQIEFMENNHHVGMCYGKAQIWNETRCEYEKRLFGAKKETFNELLQGNGIPAPTVCFRNELIKRYIYEVKPLERNWGMEDYPEWLWFSKNSKIFFMNSIYAVYREFASSVSHYVNFEKEYVWQKMYMSIPVYFLSTPNKEFEKFKIRFLFSVCYKYIINSNDKKAILEMNKLDVKFMSLKMRIIKFCVNNENLRSVVINIKKNKEL